MKRFLIIVFLMCGITMTTRAQGSGTENDPWLIGSPNAADVTAILDGGVLTISGTGDMGGY